MAGAFRCQQRDRQGLAWLAALIAGAEGQARHDARQLRIVADQRAPPGIGVVLLGHGQDADRCRSFGDRAHHLTSRGMTHDRGEAAIMVAGQIPIDKALVRCIDRNRKGALQPNQS
jgi:hypothetical protein